MREQFRQKPYSLVILDLNMPGEDGLSLARYLREQHDVAIIMLTASVLRGWHTPVERNSWISRAAATAREAREGSSTGTLKVASIASP